MKDKLLEEYLDVFDEYPPLIQTINYDDEKYQELILNALKQKKPITADEVEKAFENEKYDTLPNEKEGAKMEEKDIKKIKELLKEYGAKEEEIENFMQDLADVKEDVEDLEEKHDEEIEDNEKYQEFKEENNNDELDEGIEKIQEDEDEHKDYLFNAKNMEILKATDEGKRLIINAPKMAKDELERAIKKLLG